MLGEFLDFIGDHGESLAGFSRPGCFDGGIESEQVGLLRDGGDHFDHLADFRTRLTQLGDGHVGAICGIHSFTRNFRRFTGIARNALYGRRHFLGACGDTVQVGGDLLRGAGNRIGLSRGFFGVAAHLLAGSRQLLGRTGKGLCILRNRLHAGVNSIRGFVRSGSHARKRFNALIQIVLDGIEITVISFSDFYSFVAVGHATSVVIVRHGLQHLTRLDQASGDIVDILGSNVQWADYRV